MKLIYTFFWVLLLVKMANGQFNEQSRVIQTTPKHLRLMGDACPANIGFEAGTFANWKCFTGSTAVVGNSNVITVTPSSPVPNRHTLVARAATSGIDPY